MQCGKGKSTSLIARELEVCQRRIQQFCAKFHNTGKIPVPQKPGRRPLAGPSHEEVEMVLDEHTKNPAGVRRTARNLVRAGHLITRSRVYRIMKENSLITPSSAKSRQRKWLRFERKHSNAMWHVDWHKMKEPRFRGLHLVVYLDDASRCVLGARIFTEATSENAVTAL